MSLKHEQKQERASYLWGLGLSLLLTLVAFALVKYNLSSKPLCYWLLGGLGLLQLIIQFRFFLHINLSKRKREDLDLILFSTLLLLMMVGGTLWILINLHHRMY